ncbi:rhomboid family intramembrane serine protease GlpG [Thalassotalea insulae]|uniref:Rhomboid family intramembrane serine protease GlpG n=1 Tax=Thalassotalea insulae TaxID=2056778 RepID=A0ABQ6GTI4_9GAMM|nr:rhomboid family intramembrane serine protease GlpG [Thalassotalea insulae]GLX78649.1 rhomboid family intramembrane serine protease GlpG [Thalassotalea insulae]
MQDELEPLVGISQHNIALLLANYLSKKGIKVQVIQQEQQFVVYCEGTKLQQAKTIFEQFIKNPDDKKYQGAAWDNADNTKVVNHGPSLLASVKEEFFAHAGIVTLVVFAICWAVYLAASLGWQRTLFNQLHFFAQLSPQAFFDNPFRLIGPVFFHFSILHIAFNTMWWWQLGGSIEQKMGRLELLQLFVFSGVLSNLGQFLVSGPNFGGLSGVVYGVVGYVWWAGWLAPERGLALSRPIIGFLIFWILLGFVDVLPINMANTAHLVGLVTGCVLAWLRFAGQAKR